LAEYNFTNCGRFAGVFPDGTTLTRMEPTDLHGKVGLPSLKVRNFRRPPGLKHFQNVGNDIKSGQLASGWFIGRE
jgi:hypothetical protein